MNCHERISPPRTAKLAVLCREHSISALYAFGSRAKEAADWLENNIQDMAASTSDLDLGALPESGIRLPIRRVVNLTIDLEDLFGVHRVDLVILPQAPPFLASNIVQGERLFTTDEDQADEYDLYILRRAGDLLPLHRERVNLILGGQA
ncbi:nucleotidyltransferase domain-containing protein [Desulfonatronum lacustre]|uniref:nucleotidyltransferase domain-containing protein n=1 Tax=Desulfonatronum lacustre TaxID=66849 RepID=UPI00146FC7B0|nr:nucleotidyltransferase domain-containing protein [Desulfonatronum lacustre]